MFITTCSIAAAYSARSSCRTREARPASSIAQQRWRYCPPLDVRERIDGLNVIYRINLDVARQRFGRHPTMKVVLEDAYAMSIMARSHELPRAIHPLFAGSPTMASCAQPLALVRGRIEGMDAEESDALLHYLSDHIQSSTQPLIHRWKSARWVPGTIGGCSTAASAARPTRFRRLQRTTFKGNYTAGRFEGGKRPTFELAAD